MYPWISERVEWFCMTARYFFVFLKRLVYVMSCDKLSRQKKQKNLKNSVCFIWMCLLLCVNARCPLLPPPTPPQSVYIYVSSRYDNFSHFLKWYQCSLRLIFVSCMSWWSHWLHFVIRVLCQQNIRIWIFLFLNVYGLVA